MNNEMITIKYEDIVDLPDHSISDPETIRQIALYSFKYENYKDLTRKINPMFAVCGLYPHLINYR